MAKKCGLGELGHESHSSFLDETGVPEPGSLELNQEASCLKREEEKRRNFSFEEEGKTPESGSAETCNAPLEVTNKRKRPKVGPDKFLSNKF